MKNTRFYVATLVALFGLASSSVHASSIDETKRSLEKTYSELLQKLKDLKKVNLKEAMELNEENQPKVILLTDTKDMGKSFAELANASSINGLRQHLHKIQFGENFENEELEKDAQTLLSEVRSTKRWLKLAFISEIQDEDTRTTLNQFLNDKNMIMNRIETKTDLRFLIKVFNVEVNKEYSIQQIKDMIKTIHNQGLYFDANNDTDEPPLLAEIQAHFKKDKNDNITNQEAKQYIKEVFDENSEEAKKIQRELRKFIKEQKALREEEQKQGIGGDE